MSSTLTDSPVLAAEAAPRRQSRLGRALDAKRRSTDVPEPAPLPPADWHAADSPSGPVAPSVPVVVTETVSLDDATTGDAPNAQSLPDQPQPDQPQPAPPSPEVFDPPMGGSERRVSPRYRVDGDVLAHRWLTGPGGRPRRILPATPPDAFGRMIDLGTGGVAFESDDDFLIGEELLLTLRADATGRGTALDLRRLARAAVLRTVRASNGGWTVVCRFERPLTFEEVHRIGGHLFVATIV
jgi:hypothetical protein